MGLRSLSRYTEPPHRLSTAGTRLGRGDNLPPRRTRRFGTLSCRHPVAHTRTERVPKRRARRRRSLSASLDQGGGRSGPLRADQGERPRQSRNRAMRPTTSWFSDLYGFSDETGSFEEHRAHFRMDGEDLVCATSTHPRQHVGPWETPSVAELRERCGGMTEAAGGSGLTFRHLSASSGVEPLISNPDRCRMGTPEATGTQRTKAAAGTNACGSRDLRRRSWGGRRGDCTSRVEVNEEGAECPDLDVV